MLIIKFVFSFCFSFLLWNKLKLICYENLLEPDRCVCLFLYFLTSKTVVKILVFTKKLSFMNEKQINLSIIHSHANFQT